MEARAKVESTDEIGVLAKNFNQMAEQVSSLVRGMEERAEALELEFQHRQKIEEALRESEYRYRSTAMLTNDYIYSLTVTPEGKFLVDWMTGAFQTLTGYTPEELEAHGGWSSIVQPEDKTYYLEKREEMLTIGNIDVIEYRIVTKVCKTKWVRDHRRPTWDEAKGRVVNILGASYDYTIRKETQLEMSKLAAIVENSEDAILSVDSTGKDSILSWIRKRRCPVTFKQTKANSVR